MEDPVLPKEGGIKLTISKSCYYATYITVESYRDAIYENGKQQAKVCETYKLK